MVYWYWEYCFRVQSFYAFKIKTFFFGVSGIENLRSSPRFCSELARLSENLLSILSFSFWLAYTLFAHEAHVSPSLIAFSSVNAASAAGDKDKFVLRQEFSRCTEPAENAENMRQFFKNRKLKYNNPWKITLQTTLHEFSWWCTEPAESLRWFSRTR